MSTDQVATVKSWDAGKGTGLLARDHGRDDLEISRELLVDAGDLAPGQRVAFREAYEPVSDAEWQWTIHDVRVVSDEEAAVLTLERLCRGVQHAEERMRTAPELGAGINEIGRQLFERGGSEAARRVLSQLAEEHRSTVAREWTASGWT